MPDLPANSADAAGSATWIIGILVGAVVSLCGVITYLFRLYIRRTAIHERVGRELEKAHATERATWIEEKAAWDAEREAENAQLALTYEQKHRELVEHYDKIAREERERFDLREDTIRREHAELLERIQLAESKRATSELQLLEKMHNRLSGRRRTSGE